jgi:hypothetical protein
MRKIALVIFASSADTPQAVLRVVRATRARSLLTNTSRDTVAVTPANIAGTHPPAPRLDPATRAPIKSMNTCDSGEVADHYGQMD